MEQELCLPVLSHFENGNFWTASGGRMRYQVLPDTEAEPPQLTVEVWEGPWCRRDSRVEEQTRFPMSEEGLQALRAFLLDWQEKIAARPERSLEECLRLRDARRAELAAQAEQP